jgi:general secretion pathway protein D
MKSIISLIAILLLFAGCSQTTLNTPNATKANLNTLSDVKYKVDNKGDLKLDKTYIVQNGKTINKTQTITKTDKSNQRAYEIVPNFEKRYTNSLSLKNRASKKPRKITVKGGKVKVSVESIPMGDFIDLMFGKVLKLNYSVDENVKKLKTPITLNMTSLQPKQQVFDVVSKLLSINGVSINKENGLLFLHKKDDKNIDTSFSNIYIGYGRSIPENIADDQNILMFVPYIYIQPGNTVNVMRKAGISKLQFYYMINHIQMMRGTAGDIRRALKIAKLLDRPYMEGKVPYLIEFQNIEVAKFIARMKEIYDANAIPIALNPHQSGILMSAIPELNSILAISPKKSWIDMLLYWKNKLDIESRTSQTPRFYTYKVKNRKADELAKVINSVIDIKLSSGISNSSKKTTKNLKTSKVPIKAKKIQTKHTIVADLPTNTLMMQLTPSEYRKMLPLIQKLDALPLQVLTEVTLAEVTLTDEFSLGFDNALKNDIAAASDASGGTSATAITAAFGGNGFSATFKSKFLSNIINAYASKKLLNILSKPRLLILNNKTGNINIGTQVPILTSETSAADVSSSTNTPTILRNVSYRNTGIIVGLTPTINSNGVVTMQINLQLSASQLNDTSKIDSPLIVNRSLSTTLTIKDGQTVLLGGLISINDSKTNSGVPYLMDMPWLGNAFKTRSKKLVKTELIMLIRPSIIQTPQQLGEKTRKYRVLLDLLGKYSLI